MYFETLKEENVEQYLTYLKLAMEDNQVMGRIEYHFYGCMQDGYRMSYVNWVYVLPK